MTDLDVAALQEAASEAGLVFPVELLGHCVATIQSGKHLMLTGVAGTGKTSLACLLGEVGHCAMLNSGFVSITASPDLSLADIIGRNVETAEGLCFEPGIALQAIESGAWLVIDEMNRANFDTSFGPLFTVLSGQPVTLPFRRQGHSHPISLVPAHRPPPRNTEPIVVPPSWRIVATMNDFDKETLFRMSYGLMRRFAFVEVESLNGAEIRSLIAGPGERAADLLCIRSVVDLGAALYVDAARFIERRSHDHVSHSRVLYEAFYSYFLPQLSGLDAADTKKLVGAISRYLDAGDTAELARVVSQVGRHPRHSVATNRVSPNRSTRLAS